MHGINQGSAEKQNQWDMSETDRRIDRYTDSPAKTLGFTRPLPSWESFASSWRWDLIPGVRSLPLSTAPYSQGRRHRWPRDPRNLREQCRSLDVAGAEGTQRSDCAV